MYYYYFYFGISLLYILILDVIRIRGFFFFFKTGYICDFILQSIHDIAEVFEQFYLIYKVMNLSKPNAISTFFCLLKSSIMFFEIVLVNQVYLSTSDK